MEVTFTKLQGRRYLMTVVRDRGPELAPRQGPGYHDYLPHDAVHFMVEAEAALSGGVFGRVAAGQNNIFTTADPAIRRRQGRWEATTEPASSLASVVFPEPFAPTSATTSPGSIRIETSCRATRSDPG